MRVDSEFASRPTSRPAKPLGRTNRPPTRQGARFRLSRLPIYRFRMRQTLALIVLAVLVAACGSDEPTATTSTTVDTTTTTTTAAPTTTASTPSTTVPETTTTITLEIDVEFAGGEVTGPEVFTVDLGDTVDIWILSDVDDEMHVHGYDLVYDLKAGVPFHLTFTADVPGVFEVEVHTGHTHLFDIEVRG